MGGDSVMAKPSEGSVKYDEKNDRWVGRIRDGVKPNGKPNEKKFYGKTKTEALKKLNDYKSDPLKHNKISKDSLTNFKTYSINYVKQFKQHLAPKTANVMLSNLRNHVWNHIGVLQVGQINDKHISDMINAMTEKGLSLAVHTKVINITNEILDYAVRTRLITVNPYTIIPKHNLPSRKMKSIPAEKEIIWLESDDVEKLYIEAQRRYKNGKYVYRMGLGIVLMLYTGIRLGEALGLQRKHIDTENRTMHIVQTVARVDYDKDYQGWNEDKPKSELLLELPKTDESIRDIHLTPRALETVNKLDEVFMYKPDDFIFTTESGTWISPSNMRRLLNNILAKANTDVQNVGLHTLRHTFTSLCYAAGVDIATISSLLGHKNITTTQNRYLHLFRTKQTESFGIMDKSM